MAHHNGAVAIEVADDVAPRPLRAERVSRAHVQLAACSQGRAVTLWLTFERAGRGGVRALVRVVIDEQDQGARVISGRSTAALMDASVLLACVALSRAPLAPSRQGRAALWRLDRRLRVTQVLAGPIGAATAGAAVAPLPLPVTPATVTPATVTPATVTPATVASPSRATASDGDRSRHDAAAAAELGVGSYPGPALGLSARWQVAAADAPRPLWGLELTGLGAWPATLAEGRPAQVFAIRLAAELGYGSRWFTWTARVEGEAQAWRIAAARHLALACNAATAVRGPAWRSGRWRVTPQLTLRTPLLPVVLREATSGLNLWRSARWAGAVAVVVEPL